MIRPKPSFKKCPICGKTFWWAPKSDCLTTATDFVCGKCSGRSESFIEKIINVIKK